MSLAAIEFAFFFPVVWALYWLMPRQRMLQNALLLLASYLFFASWSLRLLPLLVALTLCDFAVARLMVAGGSSGRPRLRQAAFLSGIAVNVGVLALLKYEPFLASSLNSLLTSAGFPSALPLLHLAIPIGLSFYTLSKLGYLIDVYHERVFPSESLLDYALFVSFFPQLLAGPISSARAMLPQLAAPRSPRAEQWASGATHILFGLFAKLYLAPIFAQSVNPVFADPERFNTISHWVALACYAGQVLCDFGGYSAIAIGAGKLLGLELPRNFAFPFATTNLLAFWRNWHISLSTWLFEYLFVPMTTGKGWFKKSIPAAFTAVFLFSGLWHGATWPFVLWGLVQGIGLAVHAWWDEAFKRRSRADRRWVTLRRSTPYLMFAWAVTQFFFVASMLPFRAATLGDIARFWPGLLQGGNDSLVLTSKTLLLAVVIVAAYHGQSSSLGTRIRDRLFRLPAPVRGLAYGALIAFLLLFAPIGDGAFIYAQF